MPARSSQRWDGERLQLRVPLSAQRSDSPATMHAVVADAAGGSAGFELRFAGERLAADRRTPAAADEPCARRRRRPPPRSLASLAFAFLGGLLLNLMPCVFPVLSLKVLGFAGHGQDRRQLVAGGLAYTVGVVLSFVALAGAAARVARRRRPARLGLPAAVAGLRRRPVGPVRADRLEPPRRVRAARRAAGLARLPRVRGTRSLDHGLTGVLAVAVASPCTDAVHGRRARRRADPAGRRRRSRVFAALGAGMAAPYLAASLWPGLARRLPRPGPWMVRVPHRDGLSDVRDRRLAGLGARPAGRHRRRGGAARPAARDRLLALAALVGAGGRRGARTAVAAAAAVIVATRGGLVRGRAALGARREPRRFRPAAPAGAWQPWSPAALAQARADGRPVFVDFTAAWCVTCQINKRADARATRKCCRRSAPSDVLLLRADWTRRDSAITEALRRPRPQRRAGLCLLRARRAGAAAAVRDPDRVRGPRRAERAWPAKTAPSEPEATSAPPTLTSLRSNR